MLKMVKIKIKIAGILPRWLVYWASMRLLAHATTGQHSRTNAAKITALEALNRWDKS